MRFPLLFIYGFAVFMQQWNLSLFIPSFVFSDINCGYEIKSHAYSCPVTATVGWMMHKNWS